MGSVFRFLGLPSQMKALRAQQRASAEAAALADEQANLEHDEALYQADTILKTAAREAEAIGDETRAIVAAQQFNADQLATQAEVATAAANIDEVRQRRENQQRLATQFAGITGTGFRTEDYEDLIRTSAEEAEMDALLIRKNGVLANLDFAAQSALKAAEAAETERAGAIEQISTIRRGRTDARTVLFTGSTRSRASMVEATQQRANERTARARRTGAVLDTFASAANDAAKVISLTS